ncbi:hypothetical protein J6590_027459, partial [Homalodisca vitripennis]
FLRLRLQFRAKNADPVVLDSCRDTFRELRLLTLPCLYISGVTLYSRFKCDLAQGRNVHQYGTTSVYKTERQRLVPS